MSRCGRVHGYCHGDTETQRRGLNAETAKPAERSAQSPARCHAAIAPTDFATETRRHREERRTQRDQRPERSAPSEPRCHAAIAPTDFATEPPRHREERRTQ